jgi:1,2-phenylacetyl-CoA epoxidase PaaB subunit
MRSEVLELMSKDNIIEFAEVEYRPRSFRNINDGAKSKAWGLLRKKQHPRVTRLSDDSGGLEMAQLPTRKGDNVLSKAPGKG